MDQKKAIAAEFTKNIAKMGVRTLPEEDQLMMLTNQGYVYDQQNVVSSDQSPVTNPVSFQRDQQCTSVVKTYILYIFSKSSKVLAVTRSFSWRSNA